MTTPDLPVSSNTSDERIMAALAHLCMLIPMFGMLASIIIWVTQREKSSYVRYQALQAVAFQLTQLLTWILGFGCYIAFFFLMFAGALTLPLLGENAEAAAPVFGGMFLLPILIIISTMGILLIFLVYGVIGAILTFQGKNFRYAIIGRLVHKYLNQNGANQ